MTWVSMTGLGPDRQHELLVSRGPLLLRHVGDGPGLAAHRDHHGRPPVLGTDALVATVEAVGLRGRGGAGFPFARKLATAHAARGRPTVVVNLAEGEPASRKDGALALTAPHLVLDGAAATARALGTRSVRVVVPDDEDAVVDSVRRAVEERRGEDRRLRWDVHRAVARFVSGQARAVVELLSGRPNLPVTSWEPEAVRGYRNRPTLLSNAETFAHLGVLLAYGVEGYRAFGTPGTPGTTLLTVGGDGPAPRVVEVPLGTPWPEVLGADVDLPVLVGGYHGTWAAPGALRHAPVDRDAMARRGLTLGAGVVLPLPPGHCPLRRTAEVVRYLAGQSAGRCGPCFNGLPPLADAMEALDAGVPDQDRVEALVAAVTRRGACAHPDGTARLVTSLLAAFPDEPHLHAAGRCGSTAPAGASGTMIGRVAR